MEVTAAISLLPYNNYNEENPTINWDQILSSIYNGKLSSNYYSNEIQADASIDGGSLLNPDGSGWAKMAYLGWKTIGMNYLRSLNQYANGELSGLGSTVLSTMSKQWSDYGELFNSFVSFATGSTSYTRTTCWVIKQTTMIL
jgi:hypothetical protein